MSGTTIYGSTAVCSAVGKFTSCIDAGSGTFSSGVTINGQLNTIISAVGDIANFKVTGETVRCAMRIYFHSFINILSKRQ
jgi:hypothetical protein